MTGNFDDFPRLDKSDRDQIIELTAKTESGSTRPSAARQVDHPDNHIPVLRAIDPQSSARWSDATRRTSPPEPKRYRPVTALILTMCGFAAMMTVSFGDLIYNLLNAAEIALMTEPEIRDFMLLELGIFESIDTGFVVLTLVVAGSPPVRALAGGRAIVMWSFAGPCLAIMFALNIGYHLILQAAFPPEEGLIELGLADGWLTILLICVQPAVVEELFFRYLLLGHLRPHIGLHGAVGLTAVLFGMAHLGGVISWPILMMLGVGLGYARVYSGGLALPMLLHFLHNLAVLVVDHEMTS